LIRAVRDYFNEVATIRAAVEPTIFDEFPVQAQGALQECESFSSRPACGGGGPRNSSAVTPPSLSSFEASASNAGVTGKQYLPQD
jgi:hypothetical protein